MTIPVGIPITEMPQEFQDELKRKLEAGELEVGTGDVIAPWTFEQEEALKEALSKVFGWNPPYIAKVKPDGAQAPEPVVFSSGGDYPEWTPEEITRLDTVLAKYYPGSPVSIDGY